MCSKNINNISGIICDWAGPLIDFGCIAPAKVFVEVFASKGIDLSIQEARGPMGLGKKEHISELCLLDNIKEQWLKKYNCTITSQDIDELYSEAENKILEVILKHSEPIKGAVDFFQKLRHNNIKIGSTTGYTREMMEKILPAVELKGIKPDCIITPSDVPNGRPFPWMCFMNAINLGIYPMSKMVKIGDTPFDIQEGLNAGMWTIGISKSGNGVGLTEEELNKLPISETENMIRNVSQSLYDSGAHYVVETIADCIEILHIIDERISNFESPSF